MPAWTSASCTDRYASCTATYLPTSAICTSCVGASYRATMFVHSVKSAGGLSSFSVFSTMPANPSFSRFSGTSNSVDASRFCTTLPTGTLQNSAILSFADWLMFTSVRQTITSG